MRNIAHITKNYYIMRKKLLFQTLVAALIAMPITSCSKDEEPFGPNKNITDVSGTLWRAPDYQILFSNSRYTLDNSALPATGSYTQSGRHIEFNSGKTMVNGSLMSLEYGEINQSGDSMDITFKDASWFNTGETVVVKFSYIKM